MMADQTAEFFESLDERGHEPLLEQTVGTLRFDLANNGAVDQWFVDVDKGDVAVSHRRSRSDCLVRTSKRLFDGVASGRVNANAAVLRGDLIVEGDPELLTRFQRLFPGPPDKRKSGKKT